VDEEHDDSYKSSSRPRYHARDMAIYYGNLLGIPVVLGSATPSLTSFVKFPHFRLKGGHFQSDRSFEFEAHAEAITPRIEEAIETAAGQKEQAMLFIPTRANFKYLICNSCGYTYECPYCSVGMSVHRYRRQVRCHYCGYAEPIPQHCPECKTGDLVSSRLGTAEAVEYFEEHHPKLRVAQFDRDKITTQKKLKALLQAFNDHEIDLLVGTQMLSKGHDYHAVTLAIVLGLDNLLSLSDYRARERALSLLLQIAGRSGRKHAARVIVQTFNAEFFSAYVNGYERFLEEEKLFREGMYPPYKKLCRVLFAHKNSEKAEEAMRKMEQGLKAFANVEIVGAGKSPIEKIAGKYRFQILLRSDKSTELLRALRATKVPLAEIDMDPIEFG
jgi:primosomal protein N' (replication factor Y)